MQKDRKIKRNSSPAEEFILPLGEENGSLRSARIHRMELSTCGISYSGIENDHPAEQGLYTGLSVLCPESYITADLLPGESKCWKRIYRILQ